MATRACSTTYPELGVIQCDWSGLANSDDGAPATGLLTFGTKTVQAFGTFGVGGSVAIEGSNDGVTYGALRDDVGTTIALTAATVVRNVLESPKFIRCRVTAGDGTTNLAVRLVGA